MADARDDGRWPGGGIRVAWRELCATRGASLLAAALVAMPLAALSATDVLVRTAHVSDDQLRLRELGHADALITDLGAHPITQRPDGRGFHSEAPTATPTPASGPGPAGRRQGSALRRAREQAEILALLPRGARVASDATTRLTVRLGSVTLPIIARELDFRAPAAAGLIARRAGRMPTRPGEVVISSALREQTGAHLGDTLTADTVVTARVVGVVDDPNELASVFALTLPGAPLVGAASIGASSGGASSAGALPGVTDQPPPRQSWLVSGVGSLGWAAVRQLNTHGLLVISRAVLRDPPPAEDVPYCRDAPCSTVDAVQAAEDEAGFRLPGTRISLWVALPVLLAVVGGGFGAALAGCARRGRLAELSAMADGVVARGRVSLLAAGLVGLAGAVAGLPLGVGLAAGLRSVLRPWLVRDLGPLNTHPLGLLAIAGFGVLAALVPAYGGWREWRRAPRARARQREPAMRVGRLLREDEGHE